MNLRQLVAAAVFGIAIGTGGLWALASPPREGFAADPPVHLSDTQWTFDVAYDKGVSSVARAQSKKLAKAAPTARAMGRFALELWVGKELLDRIRFDVPLLGDDAQEKDPKRPFKRPAFSNVTTRVKVTMADHPRATVLAFVDRATGDTRRYFWPPDEKGQLTPFSAKAATVGPGDAGFGLDATSDGATADAAADGAVPMLDASMIDASMIDASMFDASMVDASSIDAAVVDASKPDAR